MRERFMMTKLVASTAESLRRSGRREYSRASPRSFSSQGGILTVPGLGSESFHNSAASRAASCPDEVRRGSPSRIASVLRRGGRTGGIHICSQLPESGADRPSGAFLAR